MAGYPDSAAASLYEGVFTDGDPEESIEASRVLAAWMNSITQEIINVCAAASIAPNFTNNAQLIAALNARYSQVGHAHTPAQVGLGNLPNAKGDTYATANSNSLATQMAVYNLWLWVTSALGGKANNSHTHTSSQVGLDNLPNAKSDSYSLNSTNSLATSKALYDYAQLAALVFASKGGVASGSIAGNGWWRCPDTGLELRWGYSSLTSLAGAQMRTGTIVFPTAFTAVCHGVAGMLVNGDLLGDDFYAVLAVNSWQRQSFNWKLRKLTNAGAYGVFWFAVGE